jgi:hypothetical protein
MKKFISFLTLFLLGFLPYLKAESNSSLNQYQNQTLSIEQSSSVPFICEVASLSPTQLAVGMKEVELKEKKISKMSSSKLEKYLYENPEPIVKGFAKKLYIIDHHHLARALYELGIKNTYCVLMADLSNMSEYSFWEEMENRKWVYMYDEYGNGPMPYSQLPENVSGLKDDPYRSLAGAVREEGGYEKSKEPFAEFKWADFFRKYFSREELEKNYEECVKKAVKLAHSKEASNLPGWIP